MSQLFPPPAWFERHRLWLAGSPYSREFSAARLAAGANMLRDMIYTAWLESAKLVPDPYAGK
ncbi:MAG: hypothetical protein WBE76_06810 [Terracidiphilus sp.]